MFRIARKDLQLFFTDKRAVILTFLLPIALISLFAMAFGGGGGSGPRTIRLPVADLDQSVSSKQVIARLDSMAGLELELISLEKGLREIKKGNRSAILVLHPGIGDSIRSGVHPFIELQCDEAKEAELGLLQQALYSSLMGIIAQDVMKKKIIEDVERQYPGLDSSTLTSVKRNIGREFQAQDMGGNPVKITPVIKAEKYSNSPGLVQAVAGTAIMMLLFSVAGMGAGLLEEKQEGTLKKLLCSPLPPIHILFGKMITANLISMAQLMVMLIFAWLVFGLNLWMNVPALILLVPVTAFAVSSFGIFLASIARSRQQVSGLSTLIILIMSAIGGSMIPTFVMPLWMQKMSMISLNYWGIQGFYDVFWRKLPVTDPVFLMRLAVLTGIGLLLTLVSVRFFRKNILKLA